MIEIKAEGMAEYKKMFREAMLKTECACGGQLTQDDILHKPHRGPLIKSGKNKGQEGWIFEYCCPSCKQVVEKTYFDFP